jgi:hypothetical protein
MSSPNEDRTSQTTSQIVLFGAEFTHCYASRDRAAKAVVDLSSARS